MRILVAAMLLATVGPGLAADITVTAGDTLRMNRTIYRLDGVDAPEIDQTCLDQRGDVWPCGVAARDRLSAHIGTRAVRCNDKGPDPDHKHRRIGICSLEGESTTLN
jgi:endonuclease YncB( thermonuclease family)